jgi:hypothetical protein
VSLQEAGTTRKSELDGSGETEKMLKIVGYIEKRDNLWRRAAVKKKMDPAVQEKRYSTDLTNLTVRL